MKREFLVGLVFFTLLALLLWATLWIGDSSLLSSRESHPMKAQFREVAGLTAGDAVWIYGTEAGRVKSIRPDGTGHVEVELELDYDPSLREDAEIRIQPRSALGGAVVAIHPGSPDQPAMDAGVVAGVTQADAFGEIGELAAEIRGPLNEAIENVRKITGELAERSDSIAQNIDEFAENANAITTDIRDGKGTLGKLLTDEELYSDLQAAVESLKKASDAANGGGGTIDLLLHDKEMASDLRSGVASLRRIGTRLESGEGSLGKLLNDSKLYDDLAATAAGFRDLTADARSGQGVLGKLIYDEELAARLDNVSKDIAQVTRRLRKGEGTLGKLIQDEELYVELRDSLKALRAGAGDARENAPILTFAGFLFSGF